MTTYLPAARVHCVFRACAFAVLKRANALHKAIIDVAGGYHDVQAERTWLASMGYTPPSGEVSLQGFEAVRLELETWHRPQATAELSQPRNTAAGRRRSTTKLLRHRGRAWGAAPRTRGTLHVQ